MIKVGDVYLSTDHGDIIQIISFCDKSSKYEISIINDPKNIWLNKLSLHFLNEDTLSIWYKPCPKLMRILNEVV